ncbi:MAG: flavodoxin [Akkermansia sp.]
MNIRHLFMILGLCSAGCHGDNEVILPGERTDIPASERRVLVAYFSWGGTTQKVAEEIARQTGGTLYRIEPATPYPTRYTPCTEVAKAERDTDARPAIRGSLPPMEQYDTVFVGCPVWWHTAPMIMHSFLESPACDLRGKTVIPFCTYAETYRDETLAKLAELTPGAVHLRGFGSTGSTRGVAPWLRAIGILPEQH